MGNIISIKKRKARKTYECNACLFLTQSELDEIKMTFSEYRAIVRAKWNDWKIVPGQVYERVTDVHEGQIGQFCQIPEINQICIKYDLYPDIF